MLKLFKPKKRLTISDIKIPIPMLAGIENATNLTEEQIDFFLRGGKLNIPVEQQKQQQNISPVILNEKIKPEESSSNSDYSSDSENDPIIIVDFSQKIPTEAPQEDERTLITEKDPPPESSIPMIENQNTENINATAMMTQTKDQKAPINKQEFVKNERPSQKMNSSSSSMLDVVPAPQKQEKKAEKYHEKINSLKYQLEQAHQQYYNDHQAHLRFVKEWESKDHHTLYQISLVEQRLRHVLRQRSMPSTCPQNEPSRLRTTRSYHDLMKDEAANEGECQSDYRLEKDDHGFYDAQRKDMMTHDRIYDEDAQRRWMEDYYRYCDYYYRQQPYKYHYYNENTNDYYWDDDYFRSTYEPRIPYYGSKERGIEADERGENTYYQYREWR